MKRIRVGFVETIRGEGMPIFEGTGHGDLYVEYNVVLPNKLSPELRKRMYQAFPLPEPSLIVLFLGLVTAFEPDKKHSKTEL